MLRLNSTIECLILTVVCMILSMDAVSAKREAEDLKVEIDNLLPQFFEAYENDDEMRFPPLATELAEALRDANDNVRYYKIRANEVYFNLRNRHLYRAMQVVRRLDEDMHADRATDYYYLVQGLMGDIYVACHNTPKAEDYYLRALESCGNRDPQFYIQTSMGLAEMLCMRAPADAEKWGDKAIAEAKRLGDRELLSMATAMRGYVAFMVDDAETFATQYKTYREINGKKPVETHYANIMEVAQQAFNKHYDDALLTVQRGKLNVDSSLVVIKLHVMAGHVDRSFQAMRRRYIEMDSIYSEAQNTNYDEMVAERKLIQSQEEAEANRLLAKKLTYSLIGLTVVYVFVYIMGRRRLMRKIWSRNRRLKEAALLAEQSDKMKTAFIKHMSHEIRTPLNAVSGFSQLICNPDMELSEVEKEDMRQRIAANVNDITAIVDELLELSKSESESNVVMPVERLTDVNCNEVCRSVMQAMAHKNPSGVEMRFTSALKDDFTFKSDANKLGRILSHLIDNAQKFTQTGYILVGCLLTDGGHKLEISVLDTGIEIPPKDAERIFENFVKLNDFKEGIGLGLPICRRLASSLGGTVTLDTNNERGSRFIVSLPLFG